jgi:hypothetical protein
VLVSVSFHLYDADAWEHLVFGKAIWALGTIPHRQIFTWPNLGAPLVNPSWGFSALVWPLWSMGGVTGLFVWRWLTTLIVFALLWLTARRLGAVGLAPWLVLVVCALVYRQRSQIRPETLASVWFALTLWLLETRRQGGPDRSPWLVGVAWGWANSHISYYLGFLLVGIHLLDGLARGRSEAEPDRRRLWLVALAMAVVSFANPYGWDALARPFEYLLVWRHEPMWRVISEIKPVDWHSNLANGLPALMVGWPLLALWRWRRGGLDRVELMTCGVFTALGLSSSRFIATYALAAAPYLARDLDALMRAWPRPAVLARPWPGAVLVSVLCVAVGWREWTHYQGPIGVAFDRRHTPEAACDFMAAHAVRGRGFNDFYLGSGLLWRFWPERERLPFMDIHPEDSTPEIRDLYYRAISSPEGWRALDARYRFDYALLSRRYTERYGLLDLIDGDPSWAVVFVDDVAAVYVRRSGPLAAVADSFAYRLLAGGRTREPMLLRRAMADSTVRAALTAELERQAGETRSNLYGRQMLRAIAPPGAR